MTEPASLDARVWISEGVDYPFPERRLERLLGRTSNSGVCLSGGGTRAMSAAMGQLRALTELDLMRQVRYLSCVSGGSWASGTYTYYRSGEGLPADDGEFLGPATPPEKITREGLEQLPPTRMGWAATRSLRDVLIRLLASGVPKERVWLKAVGEVYYQPFGLYAPHHPAYFSYDRETVDQIRRANPSLAAERFYTVREVGRRPFLIMNSSMVGPADLAPFRSREILVHFEYTPLYAGSPHRLEVSYPLTSGTGTRKVAIGGGWVEPFALGGPAPVAAATDCDTPSGPGTCRVRLERPALPYQLADASGTSSSAAAALFDTKRFLDHLGARSDSWPVGRAGGAATTRFEFGDGGSLENYGLITLLLRKVEHIAVFVNSETPLDTGYDPSAAPRKGQIDGTLPPLFGFPSTATPNNHVFSRDDWPALVRQLHRAKRDGRSLLAVSEHEVQANDWWGVEGGWKTRIVWMYNDRVQEWESKLPAGIRWRIRLGNTRFPLGPFRHFPNYKTLGENLLEVVELTAAQVNLLADLSCWNVLAHGDVYRDLLARPSS